VITVTDGDGRVARCAVSDVQATGRVKVEILEVQSHRRLRPEVVIYQGIAKGRKLDDAVERFAELGVTEIAAFESARSVVSYDRPKVEKIMSRWNGIAKAGAKVARNPFVARIGGLMSWTELLRRVTKEPLSVVLWEEASFPLRTALVGEAERVALVVGPEGGLARDEAEALADAGAQLVSLGPRIFRAENAGVVATSALLYHYGLIG
jgi:16S rRNA (uracil1498-N3)-methyltransferase